MAYKSNRVASIIKKTVSELLAFELNDPKLNFPTVTDVEVTNDLAFAKIYVTFLGSEKDKEEGLEALRNAKGKIRNAVSRNLDTRRCPDLIFQIDNSLEQGNRIEQILADLKTKQNND